MPKHFYLYYVYIQFIFSQRGVISIVFNRLGYKKDSARLLNYRLSVLTILRTNIRMCYYHREPFQVRLL